MALRLVGQSAMVLRQIAPEVTDLGSVRLERLAREMDDLRVESGGIGLAAPQAGVSERVIVIELPEDDYVGAVYTPRVPPMVLVNPELVWESEAVLKLPEGCLSLPGMMGNVLRPESVKVEASDIDGGGITIQAAGWLARVLQHEIDHLDGVLFPDRIEEPGELWYVEGVDLGDPVWSHNERVQRIRRERTREGGEAKLA